MNAKNAIKLLWQHIRGLCIGAMMKNQTPLIMEKTVLFIPETLLPKTPEYKESPEFSTTLEAMEHTTRQIPAVTLTPLQQKELQGLICPYCKRPSVLTDSKEVYSKSYGLIYLCRPCNAWCGTHKKSNQALGRLANAELREAKKLAHQHFDFLWKEKLFTRSEAYAWLSIKLNIPPKYTHIGMFNPKTCKDVVYFSKQYVQDMDDLDRHMGFGKHEMKNPLKELKL